MVETRRCPSSGPLGHLTGASHGSRPPSAPVKARGEGDACVGLRLQRLLKLRQNLEQITHKPVIRHLEDRGFFVLVDGDDDF